MQEIVNVTYTDKTDSAGDQGMLLLSAAVANTKLPQLLAVKESL
jgi:hypothetical protein